MKTGQHSPRSKRKKPKTKKTHKKLNLQRESTPIAELKAATADNSLSRHHNKTDSTIGTAAENPAVDIGPKYERDKTNIARVPSAVGKAQPVKQISERKRLMTTCFTVLKYTSACPFRHHKSWFQCFYCLQEFMEINVLRLHTSETHPLLEEELRKLKRFPRSLQIDISELRCLECSLALGSVESMREHFSQRHGEVIYNECIADYKVFIFLHYREIVD